MAAFTDVTSQTMPGLAMLNSAWGDYNNDGHPDLSDGWSIWRNNNGVNFSRINAGNWPRGLWGDYNNDGLADFLSVGGNVRPNQGGNSFGFVNLPNFVSLSAYGGCWADFDGNGDLDCYIAGGHNNGTFYNDSVYLNNNGTFTRHWVSPNNLYGRGATACDFDQDGDMDVYVSNYWQQPNQLWLNNGSAVFTDVADARGVQGDNPPVSPALQPNGHTIGSSWGDMDDDGRIDLFVGNFNHHDGRRSEDARFFRNLGSVGSWSFQLMEELDGSHWEESYATPSLADYDNDGDLDLFFTTVYPGGDNARLFRNEGNWNFTNRTSAEGLSGLTMFDNHQNAWADYNDDGFLDLATGARLYKNLGNNNHWLKVRLLGDGNTVNALAIGAQARIDLGNGRILTRHVESGTGEGNGNDLTLHFGLGSRTTPVDIELFWPNGIVETINDVSVDQTITRTNPPPGPPPEVDETLLLSLDARDPGDSPSTRWVDLSGKSNPFTSNGNPVHNAGAGHYSFNHDGLFTGDVTDESKFDFDTDQGSGATPFSVVFYASVHGGVSREGMVNKQAGGLDFGWNTGLSRDGFGLDSIFSELRSDDNDSRAILFTPGSAADPFPNTLSAIGVTASVLNLYVVHVSGAGNGPDAMDVYINGDTNAAPEVVYAFSSLSGNSILNDEPLRVGGITDHISSSSGYRGEIRFIEIWSGHNVNGMLPADYSAWRYTNLDTVMTPPPFAIENPRISQTHGFEISTQPGTLYRLDSSENDAGGPWTDTGGRVMGYGGMNTLFDPGGYSTGKTYRLELD
jgi:hypothetical protein